MTGRNGKGGRPKYGSSTLVSETSTVRCCGNVVAKMRVRACFARAEPLGSLTREDVCEIVEKTTMNMRLDEIFSLEKKIDETKNKKNIILLMMIVSKLTPTFHKPY